MVRQFQFRDLLEKVVGTFNQVADVAAGQHLPLTLMGLQWKANRGTAFPSGCDIQRAWVVMDATGIPVDVWRPKSRCACRARTIPSTRHSWIRAILSS